jgi:PEP-CTERM motif
VKPLIRSMLAALALAAGTAAQANDVFTSFTLGMSPGGDGLRFGMLHSDALAFTDTIVVHGITGPVLFTGDVSVGVTAGSNIGWATNEQRIIFDSISFNGVLLVDPDGDQVWTTPGVMTFAGGSDFIITIVGHPNVPPSGIVPSGFRDYGGHFNILPLAVPEPASWALMLAGGAGLAWRARRVARA